MGADGLFAEFVGAEVLLVDFEVEELKGLGDGLVALGFRDAERVAEEFVVVGGGEVEGEGVKGFDRAVVMMENSSEHANEILL